MTSHFSPLTSHLENDVRPAAIARQVFRRYIEPKARVTFEEVLAARIGSQCGFVTSSPTCFAMGEIVQIGNGKRAWFVDIAYGSLGDLLRLMPFQLPFIAFRREIRNDDAIRVLPVEKLFKAVRHRARAQRRLNSQ